MNKSNKSERFRAIFWKSPLVLIAIALPGQFLQSTETTGTFAKTSNEFPRGGSWSLVWSDEFDYQGLPDSSKWTCEQGWKRNNESQYYTVGRLENCRVEDGMLVIEARRENFATPEGKLAVYTSASLTTKDRAAWKYGRIEIRAKLPRGKGTWPAIWMLANRSDTLHWPMCGEIDIMEHVGKEPQNVYATIHYGSKRGEHIKTKMGLFSSSSLHDEFHVYALEWNEDRLDFFVDDTKFHSCDLSQAGSGEENPFHYPFYLILNLAIGGVWGGPEVDDSIFPAKFLIDYVRVYEQPVPMVPK